MKWIVVTLALCCGGLLFTGCLIHQHPRTNFRLARKPFILQQPTALRTDGVYLSTDTIKGTTRYYYHFLRFFADGTTYTGLQYGLPIDTDFLKQVSTDPDKWGAYKNNGNEIHYEYFGDHMYQKSWALIKGDTFWHGERLYHSPVDQFFRADTISIRRDAKPLVFLPLTLNPEDVKQMPLTRLRRKRQQQN